MTGGTTRQKSNVTPPHRYRTTTTSKGGGEWGGVGRGADYKNRCRRPHRDKVRSEHLINGIRSPVRSGWVGPRCSLPSEKKGWPVTRATDQPKPRPDAKAAEPPQTPKAETPPPNRADNGTRANRSTHTTTDHTTPRDQQARTAQANEQTQRTSDKQTRPGKATSPPSRQFQAGAGANRPRADQD